MTTSLKGQVGSIRFGTPSYDIPNSTVSVDVFWDFPYQNPIQAVNIRFSISGAAACMEQSVTSASVHTPTFDATNVSFPSNNEVRIIKNSSPTFTLPAGSSFKLITIVFRPELGVSGTLGLSGSTSTVTVPPLYQISATNSANFMLPSSSYVVQGINIKAPSPQENCSGGYNGGVTAVDMELIVSASCFAGSSTQYYNSVDGYYEFTAVAPGYSYSIFPSKNDGCSCGLDNADIEAITSYILATAHPNLQQIIAADFNGSDLVTTYDIVLLRKCLLGTYDPEPGWQSWRFVPITNYNQNNPPASTTEVPLVPNRIVTPVLSGSLYFQDFYGIKRGDVNQTCALCDAFAPSPSVEDRSITKGMFFVHDRPVRAGEEIVLPVHLQKMNNTVLLNMELYFDKQYFEVMEVQNGDFGGHSELVKNDEKIGQAAHFMWLPEEPGGKNIPEQGIATKLRLKAKKSAPSIKGLIWQKTETEERDAFYEGGQALARLGFEVLSHSAETPVKFFAHLSTANPATETAAQIALYLSAPSVVNLTVFDSKGRSVRQSDYDFSAGRHSLDLTGLPELPGVYFIAVQTALGQETLRFIKL